MSDNNETTKKPASKTHLAEQLFEHWDAILKITKDLPKEQKMNSFYGMLELTGNKDVIEEMEERVSKRDDWLDSFLPGNREIVEIHEKLVRVIRNLSYIDSEENLITSDVLEIFSSVSCWHDGVKGRPDKFDMMKPDGGVGTQEEAQES